MSDNGGRFFDGLVFGALLGAIFAVLYAPQSGDKTRDWLRKAKEENQDLIDSTRETTENLINTTKSTIEQGIDKLSKAVDAKKAKAEE